MMILGLTGSIGMGKSTIGGMLEFLGIPVHDSDACVHDLMARDREVRAALSAAFPPYRHAGLYKNGVINRAALGKIVFKDSQKREELEQILHPRVYRAQEKFIMDHRTKGVKAVALDIPLLFETGAETRVDYIITVSAPDMIQRARVLSRPNMDEDKFHAILQKQMPNKEKELRSDYVIQTGAGRAHSMRQLKALLRDIKLHSTLDKLPDKKIEQYYTYG